MSINSLEQRGTQLRSELDRTYYGLVLHWSSSAQIDARPHLGSPRRESSEPGQPWLDRFPRRCTLRTFRSGRVV